MIFEWDEAKSASNMLKHGMDFETAKGLWLDENRVEIQVQYDCELRKLLFAQFNRKHWTAVFTERAGAVRIISVRRSRNDEVEYYEKEKLR